MTSTCAPVFYPRPRGRSLPGQWASLQPTSAHSTPAQHPCLQHQCPATAHHITNLPRRCSQTTCSSCSEACLAGWPARQLESPRRCPPRQAASHSPRRCHLRPFPLPCRHNFKLSSNNLAPTHNPPRLPTPALMLPPWHCWPTCLCAWHGRAPKDSSTSPQYSKTLWRRGQAQLPS